MHKYLRLTLSVFATSIFSGAVAQVSVNSPVAPPVSIKPPVSSGLDCVYVVKSAQGLTISYDSQRTSRAVWSCYDQRGGGFAEQLDNVSYSGTTSSVSNPRVNCGYIIEDGSDRKYFWITDYSSSPLHLESLSVADDSDCSFVSLNLSGNATPIHYYSINGMRLELSRELTLSYFSLAYDETAETFTQITIDKELPSASGNIYTESPLCNTTFTISGDRFTRFWGDTQSVESDNFQATAVAVHTSATQTERDSDNEQKSDMSSGFGGSAPCEITFTANVSDAVAFKEWQIATDPEFNLVTYRDNNTDITHIFREEGTSYVRFVGANASGLCEAYGDTYEVAIGASDIKCPNAFSPGTTEGVNDEWKVSYKSIVDFECTIFNRWGVKIISFSDPSQGWDGKYKGKLVSPGVYYYVIKATGADGKKYKLSGDINIINRNPNAQFNGSTNM